MSPSSRSASRERNYPPPGADPRVVPKGVLVSTPFHKKCTVEADRAWDYFRAEQNAFTLDYIISQADRAGVDREQDNINGMIEVDA